MTCKTLLAIYLVSDNVNLLLYKLTVQVQNEGFDDSRNGELDYYIDGGDDWDTDDEAEEANAADDIIRIMEGDW
jgi:hypothetical protein